MMNSKALEVISHGPELENDLPSLPTIIKGKYYYNNIFQINFLFKDTLES